MARYRVDLTDRAGNVLGVLPPSGKGSGGLTYGTTINGGGSATVTPRLTLPLISGANRDNLHSWASEIVIHRVDGPGELGPVFAGPVVKPGANLDAETLSIEARPVWAWLAERIIVDDLVYKQREQTQVAADLIRRYTTGLGEDGDIRLDLAPFTRTTDLIDRTYAATDNKTVDVAVTDLAGPGTGFDFDIVLRTDPRSGLVTRTWQPFYPQMGRRVERPLTPGRGGLRAFGAARAKGIATWIIGAGAGDGPAQLAVTVKAPKSVSVRYGIHMQAVSLRDITVKSALFRQAQEYLRHRTPPVSIITLSYVVSATVPFGFIGIGDSVRVRVDKGWLFYDDWVRIIGLTVAVDATGQEVVTCTAEGVPGLTD